MVQSQFTPSTPKHSMGKVGARLGQGKRKYALNNECQTENSNFSCAIN